MAATQRATGIVLEKEDEEYVWRFHAILEPINSTSNVRELGFIDAIKSPPTTIDITSFSCGGDLAPTTHRGFQAVQHQPCTTSLPTSAPKEINPAPLIFAALMIGIATFHGWGFYQYYRGSIDNRMECKQ